MQIHCYLLLRILQKFRQNRDYITLQELFILHQKLFNYLGIDPFSKTNLYIQLVFMENDKYIRSFKTHTLPPRKFIKINPKGLKFCSAIEPLLLNYSDRIQHVLR